MRIISLIVCLMFTGCTTLIKPGYVGICVNQYGSNKGVSDYPIKTGRVWYNPLTTAIYDYPTFMQNKSFVNNERVSFNTAEGSKISCEVGLAFSVNQEKVPHIFVKFRTELEEITHNYLRNQVRDCINKHSSEYKAIDALSTKTQELLEKAKNELKLKLEDEGFVVDTLSFLSAPEPEDPTVKQSISAVIRATQAAIEAENKVKQIEAEAKQALAKAEGEANSITAVAKAQAEANRILAESLTPELVQYKMIEKWSGIAPQVLGADSNILFNVK